MRKICGNCKLCEPLNEGIPLENLGEYSVASCGWHPENGLPISWRFTSREVMPVKIGEDASKCPHFTPVFY